MHRNLPLGGVLDSASALELAYRHPEQIAGLIPEEQNRQRTSWLARFLIDDSISRQNSG